MRIGVWLIGIGLVGCAGLQPADCLPDETYVSESFTCDGDGNQVSAGPACLAACDPNVANPCPEGSICSGANTCIAACDP